MPCALHVPPEGVELFLCRDPVLVSLARAERLIPTDSVELEVFVIWLVILSIAVIVIDRSRNRNDVLKLV